MLRESAFSHPAHWPACRVRSAESRMAEQGLAFVVHKHKATSLHYDFRLEIGGVMPSWSVPKGPTLDNKLKRLAMPTDDHDLEYRNFEGVISGGPVMIWDEGYYWPEVEPSKGVRREINSIDEAREVAAKSLLEGNLKFMLYGSKLRGSFALVRTRGIRGKESWLLIKHRDGHCVDGYDANMFDFSARSGLSLDAIYSGRGNAED